MLIRLILTMLLLQPAGMQHQREEPQDLKGKLQARVENFTLSAETFLEALTKVSAQFEIPMGIEWVKAPAELKKVNDSWRNVTVYQVVASLVRSQPGYELQIANGIVHVFPRDSRTDKHNFLNLQIDEFEVQNEFVRVASYELHKRLKRIVSPPLPSLPEVGEAGHVVTGLGDQPVSFKLRNTTVRDILDNLSLTAGLKIWIVTYPETQTLTKTGFRRTVSLYRGKSVPDDYQPIWAFLPWGIQPPRE